MAKVVIKLTDESDGTIRVRITSDPAFPGPAAADQTITTAQSWGLRFLEVMKGESLPEPDVTKG